MHTVHHIILDAASMDGMMYEARDLNENHRCLFIGDGETALGSVAPWIFEFDIAMHFAEWIAEHGTQSNWGVIIQSEMELKAVHRHFRHFLIVHDPNGKELFFRFFDPRVMRKFLPSCEPDQLKDFFGDLQSIIVEQEDGSLSQYSLQDNLLVTTPLGCDLPTYLTDIDYDPYANDQETDSENQKDEPPPERWNFR